MDERTEKIFFDIHHKMPRQGPGSYASTKRAFEMLSLPTNAKILDIGCGPGQQTLDLASLTKAHITAVDLYPIYLDELEQRVKQLNFTKVSIQQCDMNNLPFKPESFDLIWSEGAIYIMGFENGLTKWKPLLKPQGYLAVSELSWLRPDAPAELEAYWQTEYSIKSSDDNLDIVRDCGYSIIGHFALPAHDWWDDYYSFIEARLPGLYAKYNSDPVALNVLNMETEEMHLHKKYSDYYGYVFYIMQKC